MPIHKFKNTLVIAIHNGDEWIFKSDADLLVRKNMQLVLVTDPEERQEIERDMS